MGETSNFYEKCSSLSKKGDEKSLRTLLQMGISGNKTARVALRKTRNKKLLKTLIDEYLDNIPSEYNAGMILNLAVKVLRKEYLYVYLMEIFHEKKDLKEIGFFKSVKDIPLDKQEQIEVKKYIIDTKDFDIRLISLIAVEEGQYRAAMYAAVKSANPNWKPGQKFDTSILDNVTRESVESTLVKNGNRLVRNSIDVSV